WTRWSSSPDAVALATLLLQQIGASTLPAGSRLDVRLFTDEASAFAGVGPQVAADLDFQISVSLQPLEQFLSTPGEFEAHVSVLGAVPATVGVATAAPLGPPLSGSVEGLLHDHLVEYRDDEAGTVWRKQGWVAAAGGAAPEPAAALVALRRLVAEATAAVARGRHVPNTYPVLDVAFGGPERLLLHHVHEVSDWVITLDRKLGIEYFDHGGRPDRPDYLIDHTPDTLVPADRRLMVTSRSVHELTAFFRPVLADYGLPAADAHTQALLTHLRSLSGGVSLKLLSAQTQRSEAIGLALARAYLGHLGAFRNQLVVPLDDHLDLYERRPAR
ncbi:MAG: ATP-binding protein, partial [Proteobacteria bacterium]|nr:ATP-binding protein [Pseudomonadota bacterium]